MGGFGRLHEDQNLHSTGRLLCMKKRGQSAGGLEMPNVSHAVGSGHNDCVKYQTKPGTT